MAISARDIYHIESFPPLDGNEPKGRYVIVIYDEDYGEDYITVVGITTKPKYHRGRIAIPVPSKKTLGLLCKTGLPEESWALPEWLVEVNRRHFAEPRINNEPLNKITFATIAREVMLSVHGGSKPQRMD